jgi:hypothetical protein
MPQLKEDEWPDADQPTTSETEQPKDEQEAPDRSAVLSDYPPTLPPDATPPKD